MIARYLVDLQQSDGERLRRSMMIGVSCWLLPILLVSAYAIAFDPWTYWDVRSGIEWQNFEWFLLLFCGLLILPLTLFYLRRLRAATAGLALISPVLWLFILVVIVPGVNPYKGSKQIGLQIDYVLNDGQPIPMYGQLLDSTFFYTKRNGRVLHGEEELYRYLDSPDRRYVLIRSRARSEDELFTGNYHVIAREGNKAVVSNQPPRFP
jgi:hypothetical protein